MLSAAVVFAASCEKDDTKDVDTTTRIGLSPAQEAFAANGTTESGEESFVGVVTVVHGDKVNAIAWEAEIADGIAWASVEKTVITSDFKETFNGNIHQISEEGIEVKVEPNTEYKRSFTVEIRTADGTVAPFVFTQAGAKADAAVSTATKDVEFVAVGGSETIEYTTNMGDAYDFAVRYGEGSSDWLTWAADEAGKVTLTASEWKDKENTRTATFTIIVGSDATSKASVDVPVVQLAADEYYYIYGASCNGLEIKDAIQLTKSGDGIYITDTYFMAADGGKNPILINPDSRILVYPCFALAADGTVAEIAAEGAALPAGPVIDVDGRRKITVDMNARTWTWSRITVQNCMPDEELAKYKTKSFIARDGSMKTWMVEFVRWDGGDITPKLGSSMVMTATGAGNAGTGGYSKDVFPASWDDAARLNMAYENKEIGGQLEGTSEFGRIYSLNEILTGTPQAGIGYARNEKLPSAYDAGNTVIDALGDSYVIEYVKNANLTGDNAADEAAHPTLKIQIQGICPYGWHIANTADWLDIVYAASKASAGHTYPVQEDQVTYKQFTTTSGSTQKEDTPVSPRGIGNVAAWLRNSQWPGDPCVSDGAEEFGFGYYPLGFRYMTQGYQCAGTRAQTVVPLFFSDAALYRVNVIINNRVTSAEMASIDNGQAILPFRCVKNYKK